MQRCIRKLAIIALLLVCGSLSLSAATETISIPFQVKNFTHGSIRYQVNSESSMGWTGLSKDNLNITFDTNDKTKDTIFVQQQGKNGLWSPSSMLVWNNTDASWVMQEISNIPTGTIVIPFQVQNFAQGNLRYQINTEYATGWTVLSKDNMIITFNTNDKTKDIVYVQQQGESGTWSLSSKLVWDEASSSWIMHQEPQGESIEGTEKIEIPFQVENFAQGNLRYQVNDESAKGWTTLSKDNMTITFYTNDKTKDTVNVQQQGKNGAWSPSSTLVWDKTTSSWVTERTPQAIETPAPLPVEAAKVTEKYLSLAAEPILILPITEVKDTFYTVGYGADISLAWHYGRNAVITDVFYQVGTPNNIAVDIIHEGGLAFSFAYQLGGKAIKLQPEVGGGFILHAAYRGSKLLGFYYDAFALAGVTLSTQIAKNMDLFIRGQIMVYVWKESFLMYTGKVGAGISMRL